MVWYEWYGLLLASWSAVGGRSLMASLMAAKYVSNLLSVGLWCQKWSWNGTMGIWSSEGGRIGIWSWKGAVAECGVWLMVAGQLEWGVALLCCKYVEDRLVSWLWSVSWLWLASRLWSKCVHGPVNVEGMSLLMGYMCCHVWQYVPPWASMR